MNTQQRNELMDGFVYDALTHLPGSSLIKDVNKYIWAHYKDILKTDDDMRYDWQNMIRWAATRLSQRGTVDLKAGRIGHKSLWAVIGQEGG